MRRSAGLTMVERIIASSRQQQRVDLPAGLKLCGPCAVAPPVLDYEDGGQLLCGVCRKPCQRHYRLHGQIDVGECCAFDHGWAA
jgi:hypothetical protein